MGHMPRTALYGWGDTVKKSALAATLALMGLVLLLYLAAGLLQSQFWGNLLSPLGAGLAFAALLYAYFHTRRIHPVNTVWLLHALACLAWMAADILWAIFALYLHADPTENSLIITLYALPNLFFAAVLLLFAFYQAKVWNKTKLLLDVTVFSLLVLTLVWILFFDRRFDTDILLQEGISSLVCILCDLIICVAVSLWYLSIRSGKIPPFMRLCAIGILLYAVADLYYYYAGFHGQYVPNTLLDVAYTFSLLLIAAGALMYKYASDAKSLPAHYSYSSNTGHLSKEWLLLLGPLLVVLFKGFLAAELTFMAALIVIYKGLSMYILASIQKTALLEREKQLNTELERCIAEHTERLVKSNEELREKNKELFYLSSRDTLTDLYNRRYFLLSLDNLIKDLPPDHSIAVLYIDLDRFKVINDTHGHAVGDRVLIEISRRLLFCCESSGILGRIGGDEFVVAYPGVCDEESVTAMAKRIISACTADVRIDDYVFSPCMGVGISLYPQDAADTGMLMKNADIALYHAKAQGVNRYSVFSSLIQEQVQRRNAIEMLLTSTGISSEFVLYFQPIFRMADGALIGAEALIRWENPGLGMICPDEFIHIAEETDTINSLGLWVLRETIAQSIRWNTMYQKNLKIGVNISPKQLSSTELKHEISALLHQTGFDPDWLDIELTESVAMGGEYRMSQVYDLFKSEGLSVSIDDFGTGYSSIAYLKQNCFDRIKIAQPLIDTIAVTRRDMEIVQAIILLAHTIGIQTLAEGVETAEQLRILTALGCEQVQGYLLGYPVPAEEFERLYLRHGAYLMDAETTL